MDSALSVLTGLFKQKFDDIITSTHPSRSDSLQRISVSSSSKRGNRGCRKSVRINKNKRKQSWPQQ